jgi:hypothetical protein
MFQPQSGLRPNAFSFFVGDFKSPSLIRIRHLIPRAPYVMFLMDKRSAPNFADRTQGTPGTTAIHPTLRSLRLCGDTPFLPAHASLAAYENFQSNPFNSKTSILFSLHAPFPFRRFGFSAFRRFQGDFGLIDEKKLTDLLGILHYTKGVSVQPIADGRCKHGWQARPPALHLLGV